MTFKTLEEAGKFYKDYSKLANFSTKIRNTTRKGDEIKNQLITCTTQRNLTRDEPCRLELVYKRSIRQKNGFVTKSVLEAISGFQVTEHVYSHEKFRKIQAQFRGKVNCITRSMHSTLGFTTYEVVEQVSNSIFNKFFVIYDAVSREVKCQCLLFESKGILCHHSLSVLSFERVDKVAPKCILEHEPLLEPRSKRFDDLVFRSHNIREFALESNKSSLSHEDMRLSDVNNLQSPSHVRTRGRPKN
ncbi:hypothetical protein Ahy_B03g064091 [Arachis hypogaea]|uniref:SWIM-type domain-containing protein n=1 Tax=Arachis hypogaea TaxID=3818 RepID=A0A444ZYR5_ARAHY|nr:hypothetical protein Ahy_B03g064091 [Arachis hypogaea]